MWLVTPIEQHRSSRPLGRHTTVLKGQCVTQVEYMIPDLRLYDSLNLKLWDSFFFYGA